MSITELSIVRSTFSISIVGFISMTITFGTVAAERIQDVNERALVGQTMLPIGPVSDSHLRVVAGAAGKFIEVTSYTSPDKKFEVKYKRFEKMTLELKDWPIHEVFHIVGGHVVITDSHGLTRTYGPGETFVMPKGFSGDWKHDGVIEMVTVEYSAEQ